MTKPNPQRRQFLQRTGGVALTAVGATSLASTSAAAQSDDETDRSGFDQFLMAMAGIQGEIDSQYQRYFGERSDAKTNALAARDEFNTHSDEWVGYINEHASLSGDIQVLALEFVPESDEDPDDVYTAYLVTDHDGDQYTSAEIVSETDRTVDETARLESIAAENADDEIATAYDDFVSEGEAPSDRHLAYLAGKYRFGSQHVTSTILGDELEGSA